MSQPTPPTLTYPNGGEEIIAPETIIQWKHSGNNNLAYISYEIYFCEFFNSKNEPNWKQIATVPGNTSSYVWNHGLFFKTSNCRIGIRARSNNGERSEFSVSADNFSIRRKKIAKPTILSPFSGGQYDKSISIIADNSGLEESGSNRSFYQFYYSSEKLKIEKTVIAQNVAIGDAVQWDTIELKASDDYIFYATLSDNDGNISDAEIIKNITIDHSGFFIIDTVPPVGGIVIKNNDVFTNTRKVDVKVVAYDAATAVHSIQLSEGENKSSPDKLKLINYFTLSEEDAIKTIELIAQDFAGNKIQPSSRRIFDVMAIDDGDIVDCTADKEYAWFITAGELNNLYKVKDFASLILTIEETPTAIEKFGSFIYITTKDSQDIGYLYLYNGSDLELVKKFSENDSIINSTAVYDNKLYLGSENGIIYQFDGLNFNSYYVSGNPVKILNSDGNLLYMVEKNSTDVYIFNGSQFITV